MAAGRAVQNVNAARPGFLTIEQSQRLINAAEADNGFRDLVHAALLTGARYSELAALRCRDYTRGKLHIAQSKSGHPRDVTLTEEGASFFAALTVGRPADAFLLVHKNGEPWCKSEQARPMRAACARAQIKPPVGFHQLRHTYASACIMNGMPSPVLARNLGHRSTVMIERHYGHLTDNYIDDATRAHAPRYGVIKPSNIRPLRGGR